MVHRGIFAGFLKGTPMFCGAMFFLVSGLSLSWSDPSPFIISQATLTPLDRAEYLQSVNSKWSLPEALNLSLIYQEEASVEGVNADVAFAQMLLETDNLHFGGQVGASQNNFAGLGALDGGARGLSFPNPRIGVRAQIQHLKYYASSAPLVESPANPRLAYIHRACAPTVWQLSGTWASDPNYGQKIEKILHIMHDFAHKNSDKVVLARHIFGNS